MTRLVPFLLAGFLGCAAPAAPKPAAPEPAACPVGHGHMEEMPVRESPFAPTEREWKRLTAEREGKPPPPDLPPQRIFRCASCRYEYWDRSRLWVRSAADLEGFKEPPAPLVRALGAALPRRHSILYSQMSGATGVHESLHVVSTAPFDEIWDAALKRAAAEGVTLGPVEALNRRGKTVRGQWKGVPVILHGYPERDGKSWCFASIGTPLVP